MTRRHCRISIGLATLMLMPAAPLGQVRRIAYGDFRDFINVEFHEFAFRTSVAAEVQSRVGLQLVGEKGSTPTTIRVDPDIPGVGPSGAVRNVSADGDSSDEAIILRFQVPLVRVGLTLGNGTAETLARVEALTARGERLGVVEQVGVETTRETKGPFVGLETSHPEGISTIVVDYAGEVREEDVHQVLMEYLAPRPFRACLAQVAEGRVGDRSLRMILQIQNLYPRTTRARVAFWDASGDPLELPFGGEWKSSVEFEVPQRTAFRTESGESDGGVRVGYATIESTLPVAAQAIFRMVDAESHLLSEAGVEAREARVSQAFPVEWRSEELLDAGFALANTGDRETKVQLRVYDPQTQHRPRWMRNWPTLTLGPGEHKALFLSEICGLPEPVPHYWCYDGFPADEDFEGSLQVLSDEPIGVTSLRTLRGYLISSLPVGSTQR